MKKLLPIIMMIIMPVILTGCSACSIEKAIEDTGVHLEIEIDKPSDLPPCSLPENQPIG